MDAYQFLEWGVCYLTWQKGSCERDWVKNLEIGRLSWVV